MILWINPFYALAALVAALEPPGIGPLTAGLAAPRAVTAFYLITSLLAAVAGLAFMAARFRHAVRDQ